MTSAERTLSVCVVTQQHRAVVSGIGVHARNLTQRLHADGHRVHLVVPEDEAPLDAPYAVTTTPRARLRGSQARWFSLAIGFGRALDELQRRETFDVVQFTDARESLFYRGAAPALGHINDTYSADVRSLAYYRARYGDGVARWAYYRVVHALEARALRRLTRVVANSRFTLETVRRAYGLDDARLRLCYKSVDVERYRAAHERRATLPAHPPRVLFVGGNMQRKGMPHLISAAAEVARAVPDVEFVVAGRDAAQVRMEALCDAHGVRARFRFLGLQSQEQLIERYAESDVFVLPALTEALGLVFLEAMAAGVPVIGTRVGGIPEIVEDGVNGLLVPPENPSALAAALVRLLSDAALRAQFTQAGLHTLTRFDVPTMMQRTYELYGERG
jgi:glycosyltransferase involved in cell wall biosynthesis